MSLFIDSVVWIGAKLKNDQWHDESVKIINKFIKKEIKPGLSITDASTVAAMEELGIKKVYTFDKGFDKIDWVVRMK